MRVLMEHGVVPDMIVGTSAGALNGLYLAIEPKPAQAEAGAQLWREAGTRKLFSAAPSRSLMHLVRGRDYLADNAKLRAFLFSAIPASMRTFGDLRVPFYVTIAHLATQALYVYGDDASASVLDAVLLSAAVPGFFPPLSQNGEMFTDGGTASNLPVLLAIARGATEIWAIDLAFQPALGKKVRGALAISNYCGSYLIYQQMLNELDQAMRVPGMTIHHVPLYDFQSVPLGDFSQVNGMIDAGAEAMRVYLRAPAPNVVRRPRSYTPEELPPGPPGARAFARAGLDQNPRPKRSQAHPASAPSDSAINTPSINR